MKTSLVVRTKNEEPGLRTLFEHVKKQTVQPDEVVIVDSGSTDRTVEVAREFGAHIIEIKPEDFTYGRSLNIGIRAATGDVIIGISAHCVPKDEYWIERLVEPFLDENVVGVYGRQIPFRDATVIEKRGAQEAFPDKKRNEPDTRFSNAHSAVLRSAWADVPFDEELTGAEDIEWADRMRAEGYDIVYQPLSMVYHSHKETLRGVYHRFYREAIALSCFPTTHSRNFGVFGAFVRWVRSVFLDWVYLLFNPDSLIYFIKWFLLTPFFRFMVYYGQYKGIKDANRKK